MENKPSTTIEPSLPFDSGQITDAEIELAAETLFEVLAKEDLPVE